MKKVILLSLIIALAAISHAQTSDKKWGFGFAQGAYGTFNNGGVGLMPELYFSRYISPKLDIMLKGDLGLFNSKLSNDRDLAMPALNLRYKLNDEASKFRPYLFAGPGFLADNNTSGMTFNAGLGAKYYVGQATAFYFDAGYINGIDATVLGKSVKDNIWKATIGMELDFGKAKDSDMDGVPDKRDNCPDTPTGAAVDAQGCPLDTDADGVADYLDECPTVAGISSLAGCPDSDKDGIADKNDDCPNVPGLAKFKGCPDTDNDGVADSEDKCPNTPKGWKVDAVGCPLDQDKDGVADAEDKCPTIAGPKENNGCPVKEPEKKKEITADQVEIQNIKVEAVHFLSDKTYLTDYSKGIIDKLIKSLNTNADYHVNVYGYADSQGSDNYNINISQERIKTVVSYLTSKGITATRIIHQKAFGEAKPIATNDTAEGRLLNRRVEFEIFKMK